MNPKIKKLRGEVRKDKAKIAELQAHVKETEKQIRELENIDIVGMVREQGLTPEQLAELLRSLKNMPKAPEEVFAQDEQGQENAPEDMKEETPVEQY